MRNGFSLSFLFFLAFSTQSQEVSQPPVKTQSIDNISFEGEIKHEGIQAAINFADAAGAVIISPHVGPDFYPNTKSIPVLDSRGTSLRNGLNAVGLPDEVYPSGLSGATCGDKIAAAITRLAGHPGLIDVNNACGLGTATSPWAAISLPANVTLRFVEQGHYWLRGITCPSGYCDITSLWPLTAFSNTPNPPIPQVLLSLGNGANPAAFINCTGDYCSITNVALDGNYSHNSTAGPNILITDGKRARIHDMVTGNSRSDGITIVSTDTGNASNGADLQDILTYQNLGNGVACKGTADGWMNKVAMENNQLNGATLSDCPTWRMVQNDSGQNGRSGGDGLNVSCTFSGLQSNGEIITDWQFGNNFQNDLVVNGYNGGRCSLDNIITANSFVGGGYRKPADVYSEIVLIDGGRDVIAGNIFTASVAPYSEKYGLSVTETGVGRALGNQVGLNIVDSMNGWGTGAYFDGTTNGSIGQQIPVKGDANASGALDLFDVTPGASRPHKYMRVSGGCFQIENSSFTSDLFSLCDTGTLSIPAGIVPAITGTITPGDCSSWSSRTTIGDSGHSCGLAASLTTTNAASDSVTVIGMTPLGHCSLTATNATAAADLHTTYISAKVVNQITVTHIGTAGMTFDILCTPN